MKMELKTITPTQAKNWLGNNINNRNISKRRVATYVQQILSDDWQLNGETIKLTEKGVLLDGQHRLQAVIQANKSIQSYVLTGVKSDVFKTIDTGKGRGASDILSIAGFENTVTMAAAIRSYYTIQGGTKQIEGSGRPKGLTNLDILKFAQSTKKFPNAIKDSLQYKKVIKFIRASNCGALYYLFSQKSAADCAQFFHELNSGEGLKNNRPAFMLREKLISLTGYNETDVDKARWLVILFSIQAWNAFRTKKTIEKFSTPHKFDGYPEIL